MNEEVREGEAVLKVILNGGITTLLMSDSE